MKIFYGTMQKWGWRFDSEGAMNEKDGGKKKSYLNASLLSKIIMSKSYSKSGTSLIFSKKSHFQ